jgi:hypothetical protein
MPSRPNMFNTVGRATISQAPTVSTITATTSSGEIDLREEFDCFVYGPSKDLTDGHGHLFLIRRLRRDASGVAMYCTCAAASDGRHADSDCSFCYGEGYLFDETWEAGYSQYVGPEGGQGRKYQRLPPGLVRTDYLVFYLRYDVDIKFGDKIVEVELDLEGNPIAGPIRKAIHKPQTIMEMRSDHGRLEFYSVYCREEDSLRPDEFGV